MGQAGWGKAQLLSDRVLASRLAATPSQEDQGNRARLSCWAWRSSVFAESDWWFGFARASPCCVDLHLMCPLFILCEASHSQKPQCHRSKKGFFAPPFLRPPALHL